MSTLQSRAPSIFQRPEDATDQNAATYWYHDHTFTTAENIYRGLAGFYIITDPAEEALNLPSGEYDIPLMIQDRTLTADNSLFYEVNPDIIGFGFVGETVFVNGAPTPFMAVANRKYRFRVLNAANRSEFNLGLGANDPMTVIGSDGGLLEAPDNRTRVPIFNGERYDIVIDFPRYEIGSSVVLSPAAQALRHSRSSGSTSLGRKLTIARCLLTWHQWSNCAWRMPWRRGALRWISDPMVTG